MHLGAELSSINKQSPTEVPSQNESNGGGLIPVSVCSLRENQEHQREHNKTPISPDNGAWNSNQGEQPT